ncbi:HisA/HisF-related TIM barrel protein [Moorella sulfitireducens]|uniref:HisA/HisF-related TIM barrel protein n=1 Tax=Neomoorella sulfitireducens TaxID=2972948 RepID=UPI0021ABAD5E|nr:HisA/HisF-related TIM barrel protein [Moorella sulfitireducens]
MNVKSFRLIPVIDMKDGLVVHALRGERENYKPIKSVLTSSAELDMVIEAFVRKFGLREFYLADLDAIAGDGHTRDGQTGNLNILARIIQRNREITGYMGRISFMVDAGAGDVVGVEQVLKAGADQVVIGTETLISLSHLEAIIKRYSSRHIIVSLDSREGRIISATPELADLTPPQALRQLRGLGVKKFILLELNRVGTGAGPDRRLIRECIAALVTPDYQSSNSFLLVGGGVSGFNDLQWLANAGIDGALVATALHNGSLTYQDIKALKHRTH